ncbi:hypothetical protein [Streptomyces sp. NRRL B-1140]|uniref:hypothetical protein n=1 Tax=Streptomyces sp. NRRL B-1140 TaxID=1415549 RepID=UPI001F16E4C1|nr:hypothetical protein [Streptomyces sp. NRRL B-1140]
MKVYSFARSRRDRSIAEWSTLEERRARQRMRAQAATLKGLLHAGVDERALEAADAVDIPPTRHRRSSLWHA